MELHHSKHHQTYVTSYNTQIEKLQEAQAKGDITTQIAIQPMINFHGGMFRQLLTSLPSTAVVVTKQH